MSEAAQTYQQWLLIAARIVAEAAASLTVRAGQIVDDPGSPGLFPGKLPAPNSLIMTPPGTSIADIPDNHPLARLLRDPQPDRMAWYVWFDLVLMYKLAGVAYLWTPPGADGLPAEMYTFPPHWVWPQAGEGGTITGYRVCTTADARARPLLSAEDVIQFHTPSPCRCLDIAVSDWRVLERDYGEARVPLSSDQNVAACEQRFLDRFGRTSAGDDSPPIPLMSRAKSLRNDISSEEARDVVLNMMGVPMVFFDPEKTNYKAHCEACQFMLSHTLMPMLMLFSGALGSLARRFGPDLCIYWELPDTPGAMPASTS